MFDMYRIQINVGCLIRNLLSYDFQAQKALFGNAKYLIENWLVNLRFLNTKYSHLKQYTLCLSINAQRTHQMSLHHG